MFIPSGGGVNYIKPRGAGSSAKNDDDYKVTLSLTNPTGSVVVEQLGDAGWFPVVIKSEPIELSSTNTMQSLYAPAKLRVTATGTGVNLYT